MLQFDNMLHVTICSTCNNKLHAAICCKMLRYSCVIFVPPSPHTCCYCPQFNLHTSLPHHTHAAIVHSLTSIQDCEKQINVALHYARSTSTELYSCSSAMLCGFPPSNAAASNIQFAGLYFVYLMLKSCAKLNTAIKLSTKY